MPSTNYENFIVDEDMVAMYIVHSGVAIVWDLLSQVSREIDMVSRPLHLILNSKQKSLVGMHLESSDGRAVPDGTRFPFARLVGNTYHFDEAGSRTPEQFSFKFSDEVMRISFALHSSNHLARSKTLVLGLTSDPIFKASRTRLHQQIFLGQWNYLIFISYNVVTNKPDVRICSLGNVDPLDSQRFSAIGSRHLLYYSTDHPLPSTIKLFNALGNPEHLESEIGEIETAMTEARVGRFPPDADDEHWLNYHQPLNTGFGDERYYGMVSKGTITVWCFDPDVVMAGDRPMYREIRERRAANRARERAAQAQQLSRS